MPNPLTILLGRIIQAAAGLRGGGTALPGLVVEKLEPNFAVRILEELPHGVVLVSGTNGKTTTVKVVTELLTAGGLRVFSNNTGSNFMRGVISSLLRKVSITGKLEADIAVLELDEAHAVSFVEAIKPRYSLLLNVMSDQLDRFGNLDYTAQLLSVVARNTTDILVLNCDDSRLATLPAQEVISAEVRWFALASHLKAAYFEDDSFYEKTPECSPVEQSLHLAHDVTGKETASGAANIPIAPHLCPQQKKVACLTSFSENQAHITLDNISYEVNLLLKGLYNILNVTAALALVHAIIPEVPVTQLVLAAEQVEPAFGRGERVDIDGHSIELILVKNPGGFRLALKSYEANDFTTMIAISDNHGDGRDISWLFDVDFSSLKSSGVAMVSGTRAYDMALRLDYDEIPLAAVEPDLRTAFEAFLVANPHKPHRIYCSYTAMLTLRKLLTSKTKMERIQ